MKKIVIGIDISKETFDATVLFAEDFSTVREFGYSRFDNRPAGFRSLVAWAGRLCKANSASLKDDALFCMETTGSYDMPACQYLYEHGLDVWRESALQIRRSSGFRRGKDDKADSKNIAEYALKNQVRKVSFEPDPKEVAELKEALGYRNSLVEHRKQAKTRVAEKDATAVLKSSKTLEFISRLAREEIETLDELIKSCEDEIMRIINSNGDMKAHFTHITSIKGIGLVNAASLIAYSCDFSKIRTANKMACYCGAVTFYEDSGTSVHRKDPNKNICCKRLKRSLQMAAMAAICKNPDIKDYAQRLNDRGKPYGIILNNVVNKLLHIAYSLVKNDCDYEADHEKNRKKENAA